MTGTAEIILEDPRWESIDLETLSGRAVRAAFDVAGIKDDYDLCIMGCDDARICGLNSEFRAKPAPTNVLSWPAFDLAPDSNGQPPQPPAPSPLADSLGDIAISYETCLREAAQKDIPVEDHVIHLVIHGTLHLLGYDHLDDTQAHVMEGLEITALASMGIKTPY